MNRGMAFFLAGVVAVGAGWGRGAGGGEIVHGRVKVVYTKTGYMNVFHDGVEMARKFMMYRHNWDRDHRMSFHFPGRGQHGKAFSPKVTKLSDQDGNQTGSVVTWDLNPAACPNELLDPRKDHFVRVIITANDVKVHFRAEGAYPSMKGTGLIMFLSPEASFRGGTYSWLKDRQQVTKTYPAPGAKFERPGGTRDGYVITTAKGVRMTVTPSNYKVALRDYRHRSGDEKNTWLFLTHADWHIDWGVTLAFEGQAGK